MNEAPESDPMRSSTSGRERVEELLDRLQRTSNASLVDVDHALDPLTGGASSQADALRATLKAQQDAEAMVASASAARRAASEQAEQILLEAQRSAERLTAEAKQHRESVRRSSADWAADQRATVESLVAELIESANRDADAIRAEALASAMAEAEETAQRHLARALVLAERDAEEIRREARELLSRSQAVADEARDSVSTMATALAGFLDQLHQRNAAIQEVLAATSVSESASAPQVTAATESPASFEAQPELPPTLSILTRPEDHDFAAEATQDAELSPTGERFTPSSSAGVHGRPLGSLFRGPDRA